MYGLPLSDARYSDFFHQHYPDHVVVLQETHSSARDVPYWVAEWGGQIFFSHGPTNAEYGVAVLLPRALQVHCVAKASYCADNGRMVVVELAYMISAY